MATPDGSASASRTVSLTPSTDMSFTVLSVTACTAPLMLPAGNVTVCGANAA